MDLMRDSVMTDSKGQGDVFAQQLNEHLEEHKVAPCARDYYEELVSDKLDNVICNGMLAGDQQSLSNGGSYLLEIKGQAVANWPDLFAGEYVIRNHMSRKNISIADFNFREIGIKNKARLVYERNDCWKANENIFLINKSIYLYLGYKGSRHMIASCSGRNGMKGHSTSPIISCGLVTGRTIKSGGMI